MLVPMKGTLRDVSIYIRGVESRNNMSNTSELIFFLNKSNKQYKLTENIGDDYVNKEYEKISQQLKSADTVVVWIKKSEIDNPSPKVFQIDVDNANTILSAENVRTEKAFVTVFLLMIGTISILLFFGLKFPELARKIFPSE